MIFDFLEKSLGTLSLPHFVYIFTGTLSNNKKLVKTDISVYFPQIIYWEKKWFAENQTEISVVTNFTSLVVSVFYDHV